VGEDEEDEDEEDKDEEGEDEEGEDNYMHVQCTLEMRMWRIRTLRMKIISRYCVVLDRPTR